jgi:hypothetical protein
MIGPEDERPKDAFQDAVTVELCDLDRGVCALLRLARVEAGAGTAALALLCSDGRPAAALDERHLDARVDDWSSAEAAGIRFVTVEPLARWRARGDVGGLVFSLEVEAISPPIEFDEESARTSGVWRYEQLCRVRGEISTAGGPAVAVDGVGRRAHAWGEPVGARFRSLYAIAGDRAVTVSAVRPAGSTDHGGEVTAAWLLGPESEPEFVEEARLSTIYDAAGRPRSAGAELLLPSDEYPRRLSGEAVCHAAPEFDALQAACFRWSLEGDPAQGGYQVVTPA